jgi:hypothetical protein
MARATLALRDEQTEQTLRLELAAARDAAKPLERRVNAARDAITASYVAQFGGTDQAAIPGPHLATFLRDAERNVRDAMDGQGRQAEQLIAYYAQRAAQLGHEHAVQVVEDADPLAAPTASGAAGATAVRAVDRGTRAALQLLTPALVSATGYTGVLAVVGAANRTVADVKAAARGAVNEEHNHAVHLAADRAGYGRVWVSERDGCVECLAYAGQVAWTGEQFPGGLTMDTRPPRNTAPLPDPPLHPNCRCQVMPHHEDDGQAFPEALKREARRSIAKGWRVESESEGVRLRAAESLLRRGADLPASVQDGAARSLARGKFPDRRVPRYTAP